ncbi:helix-turn-helix domain-containing protein [Aestuariivirga sp.]|jgi:cytoskeleton protein RodZ|uniref:helix-turn-helix domain-containing protein n=1 Tax=Aestuariivirga sp. TaxID=2650926 RepID=UPI0037845C9C
MRNDSAEMSGEAEMHAMIQDQALDQLPEDGPAYGEGEAVELELREKPDPEIDPLGEAGWYLEVERLTRGLSLEDAAEQCGIHPYHLEAIEYGDLTCLPERHEALDMIGVYAQSLGFDPEPLMQHFAHYMPAPALTAEARHPANPAPLSSAKILSFTQFAKLPKIGLRRMPGGVGGLVASLAAVILLFAAASYILMPSSESPSEITAELSANNPPPAPESAVDPMATASTATQTAEVESSGQAQLSVEPQPATTGIAGEDDLVGTGLDGITALIEQNVPGTVPAAEAAPATTDVAMTAEGRQFGASNDESRVTLVAKAPVWVRIEDNQGRVIMTQMLMKGDSYRVPNRDGLVLIARDGGLLTFFVDGKEKGVLGSPGEILVGRSLDIKSLEG